MRAFHLDEPDDLSVRLRVEADSGCAIAAAQLRPALAADMPAKQRRTLMVGLTRAVRDTFKSLGLPANAVIRWAASDPQSVAATNEKSADDTLGAHPGAHQVHGLTPSEAGLTFPIGGTQVQPMTATQHQQPPSRPAMSWPPSKHNAPSLTAARHRGALRWPG